jgi:preprotein translocase subunit SecD
VPPLTSITQAEAAFASFNCGTPAVRDDPDNYLVACDEGSESKYLLAPQTLDGTQIKTVDAGRPDNSIAEDWQIDITFNARGTTEFAQVTRDLARLPQPPNCQPPVGCNALAIVLDGVVQSAPYIVDPNGIQSGHATISGNFTKQQAEDLAAVLKYGALPGRLVLVSATRG